MSSAAILTENLADAGTLTASSEVTSMPVSLLTSSPHVTDDLWRSAAAPAWFELDLGADVAIDTVALLGLTMSAAGTARLRISTASGGPGAGDGLDTGVLSTGLNLDQDYRSFVYLAAAPVTGRYVRFDLADAAADYVEAGRLVVGSREALDYNFAPGSQFDWVDPSPVRKTKAGQTLTWQRPSFRVAALGVPWVTEAQRWGLLESLGRVIGRHRDVLLVLDPDADNLPRWTIWGLLTEQVLASWTEIDGIFQKQLKLEERL